MTPPASDRGALDRMLDNSGWLRALALELLNDPSLADDVLQEVWMTAIRRPPDGEEPRSQRSWLKKVLRTFALRANRSQRRRRRWEKEAPPPENDPTPEEMVERLEMQGRLAEAIRSLPEPYRSVVFLRFYEQKDPQAVAASRGVPASTIRTQLQRGLGLLRSRLDESQRTNGRSWRASLVLMLGGPHAIPALPSAPSPTSATQTSLFRWAAVITVATVGWIAIWSVTSKPGAPDSSSGSRALAERAGSIRDLDRPATGAGRGDLTAAVAGSEPSRTSGAEQLSHPREAGPSQEHWPLVVVDDQTDRPIAGAAMYLAGVDEAVGDCLGRSNDSGRLQIPASDFCRESIRVFAPGYVEYREPARRRTLEHGPYLVRLAPIPRRTLTVLNPDRSPAAGVTVLLDPALALPSAEAENRSRLTARTDHHGVAAFDVPFHDPVVVIDAEPWALVVERWTSSDLTITLEPGRDQESRLVDHRGEGIPHAHVEVRSPGWGVPQTRRTDAAGHFLVGRLADRNPIEIRAYPKDRPAIAVRSTPPVEGAWVIEVPAGFSFAGRILGPDGAPAAGAIPFLVRREAVPEPVASISDPRSIPAINSGGDRRGNRRARYRLVPYSRGITAADGSFVVGPVAAPDELFLLVHHPTLINRVLSISPADPRPLEVQLESGRPLSGTVVDPNGQPMAGVVLHIGERYSNDTEGVLGRMRTDGSGNFTVGVPTDFFERMPGRASITREAVFIAAFHPDELLAKNWERLETSPVHRSAVVDPNEDNLTLIAATSPHARDFAFRFYDEQNQPLRDWTPAVVFNGEGDSFEGAITAFGGTVRFHSDVNLAGPGPWTIVTLTSGYRWRVLPLAQPGAEPIDITLQRVESGSVRTRFVTPAGEPLVDRTVAIDVSTVPGQRCLIAVGQTGPSGELPPTAANRLPRGDRAAFVSAGSSRPEAPGQPIAFEPGEWVAVGVLDLSVEQLGIRVDR